MNTSDNVARDVKLSDYYSGHENLELLSQTRRFNDWIYEQVLPGLKGDVLEVGSGIGTFSEKIIRDLPNSNIIVTDVSSHYVKQLEQKFCNSSNNNVSSYKLDLNCKEDYEKIGYEKFDSIMAINVLEHVEHDEFALQQLYKMLRRRGILIILVPCYKFLYNAIDKDIGHFRRYTKSDLELRIKRTQFSVDRMFYFNMLGIIGWYLNGNLAKRAKVNGTASKIFERTVPLSRYIEKIVGKKIGLSLICYLKKTL
jgi:ubiquinone/menaquinone biosynthesis C-methylase UbiE